MKDKCAFFSGLTRSFSNNLSNPSTLLIYSVLANLSFSSQSYSDVFLTHQVFSKLVTTTDKIDLTDKKAFLVDGGLDHVRNDVVSYPPDLFFKGCELVLFEDGVNWLLDHVNCYSESL